MERIKSFLEEIIGLTGLTGRNVDAVRYVVLVVLAFGLAWFSGWVCRKLIVPLLLRIARRTATRWDDVVLNRRVLTSASHIIPAIVIWVLLPLVFYENPDVAEIVRRLTAIYFTVMTVSTIIVLIDALKLLENGTRTARQQYLYSISAVLKIVMIFISVIVVIAILIDKSPTALFAGLGAASAILMLAFQDTIKGLVAGIRLTSNDMLHIGDWITVPGSGADGKVEDISLTMVKVRNFDNTIVSVTPQMLVDGSFQNWLGMEEKAGRKQVRRVYFDFRSLAVGADGVANITRFRNDMEQWLRENPKVMGDNMLLVRQADGGQTGCCLEFIFWLHAQSVIEYEHDTSDIMEHIFASSTDYGLRIYQQFPDQRASD